MENVLHGHVGRGGRRGRRRQPRSSARSAYQPPVNGIDVQLSIDLDLQQYAERLLETQLQTPAPARPPPTRWSTRSRRHRGTGAAWIRLDPPTGGLQGAGRLGDGDGPAHRPDPRHGELPDVRQPLVQRRRRRRQVRGALPARARTPIPTTSVLTNRAIQGQYNLGSTFKPFTAYSALATGLLGPDDHYNDTGTYELTEQSVIADDRCAEARAVRVPQRDLRRSTTGPACTGRSTRRPRSPCRATPSSTSSARSSTSPPAPSCRTRSASSASAPTPGSTCPYEFDGPDPDQRAEEAAARRRRPGRRRDAEPATRRHRADGGRPGPAGGDAAAGRRRLRGDRQRRPRAHARTSCKAIYEPGCPTASPGTPPCATARWSRTIEAEERARSR